MDLLQSVRKEGSRGGVNFSWDDVKGSQHRENYLGHSLMAPVGRWQKGKDLGWYAKAEDAELSPEERTEKERERKREEMRKIKQAEDDAIARALGLPVPDRTESNPNEEPLGMSKEKQKEVNQALKEALDDEPGEDERGVGYKDSGGRNGDSSKEVLKGSRSYDDRRRRDRSYSRERRAGHDDKDKAVKRRRSPRSRDRDRDRRHRHHRHDRSRSRSREARRRSRSRDRPRHYENRRRRDYDDRSRSRDRNRRQRRSPSRSRSPDRRRYRDER